ncbi:MAG: hypothetical protein ACRCTZ_07845 [Sarcina sp.]
MKIRELRDYLNGLKDEVIDNDVVLSGVYDEFYSKDRDLAIEILGLNGSDDLYIGVDDVELTSNEYITIVDTKSYVVNEVVED